MAQSRRTFIKRGFFGGALLTLSGTGWLAVRRGNAVTLPADGLKVLSAREYAVVDAVARRLLVPRPGWPSIDEVGVARVADRTLSRADEATATEVRQLLELFDNALAGFLLGRRLTPFTRLPADEQDLVLREWETSRLAIRRTGYLALRSMVMASYYQDPRVWRAVGYPGPPAALHDPNAPVWKGDGAPRPPSPGIWVEPT